VHRASRFAGAGRLTPGAGILRQSSSNLPPKRAKNRSVYTQLYTCPTSKKIARKRRNPIFHKGSSRFIRSKSSNFDAKKV
jgi:hypothetical protein